MIIVRDVDFYENLGTIKDTSKRAIAYITIEADTPIDQENQGPVENLTSSNEDLFDDERMEFSLLQNDNNLNIDKLPEKQSTSESTETKKEPLSKIHKKNKKR